MISKLLSTAVLQVLFFSSAANALDPITFATVPVRNASQVIAGGSNGVSEYAGFACALIGTGIDTGLVKCWGWSSRGELGDYSARPYAVPVPGLSKVVALAAGSRHACALISDGHVKCWGDNQFGQLGRTTTLDHSEVAEDTGLYDVIAITAGSFHTCAVRAGGTVSCWGLNNYGQLGIGTTVVPQIDTPSRNIKVGGTEFSGVVGISAGTYHTCGYKSDGSLWCWGSNTNGELGDGNEPVDQSAPVRTLVFGYSDNLKAISIAVGAYHACANTTNAGLLCWGYGIYGQIGDDRFASRDIPTAVDATKLDPSEVGNLLAGGFYSTCATKIGGSLYCWGNNDAGQLGNGTTAKSAIPMFVAATSGSVTSIALSKPSDYARYSFSCAVIANDKVQCWGDNASGELGDGTLTSQTQPTTFVQEDLIFRSRFEPPAADAGGL